MSAGGIRLFLFSSRSSRHDLLRSLMEAMIMPGCQFWQFGHVNCLTGSRGVNDSSKGRSYDSEISKRQISALFSKDQSKDRQAT